MKISEMTPEQAEKYRVTKRAWKDKNKEKMQAYRQKYNEKQKQLANIPEAIAKKEQEKAILKAEKEKIKNELAEQKRLAREQKAKAIQELLQLKRKVKEQKDKLLAEKQKDTDILMPDIQHISRKDKTLCDKLIIAMEQEQRLTGEQNRNINQCYEMCELINNHFKQVKKLKEQKQFKPDYKKLDRLHFVHYTRKLAEQIGQFYELMQSLAEIDLGNLEQITALYDVLYSINIYFKEKYKNEQLHTNA